MSQDPDASRSSAERGSDGPAKHERRAPGGSLGSAGPPGVEILAELPVHSLHCNKFGPDHSSDKLKPEYGSEHTERSELSLNARLPPSADGTEARRNAAQTFSLTPKRIRPPRSIRCTMFC